MRTNVVVYVGTFRGFLHHVHECLATERLLDPSVTMTGGITSGWADAMIGSVRYVMANPIGSNLRGLNGPAHLVVESGFIPSGELHSNISIINALGAV